MKRNLAGVVAVSIAALLFAGCAGGDNGSAVSNTSLDATTTTTIDLLANCVASYEESSKALDQALAATKEAKRSVDPYDPSAMKAIMPPLVAAQKTFAESMLRMNCPENLRGDIDSVVKATWGVIAVYEVIASGKVVPTGDATTTAATFNSAVSIFRAKLGLPAPN
jgi:hypothetical protein